jgi:hypothetical protein
MSSGSSSVFAGFRFPAEAISMAVAGTCGTACLTGTWRSCWPSEESPFDHVTIYRWVQRFTTEFIEAARPVGCQNCAAGLDLAFHSSLVFVDEGVEDWPMLDPLAGAVGGASSAIGAAWRRWPRRWPCCAGRSAGFAVGRPVQLWPGYPEVMSELSVDGTPGVAGAARDAARGHVVYLTEHGERLAAIVPAEFAEALEGMSEQDARELLEDLADAAAARQALAEPGESIPWEQVRAEAGL